MISGCAYCDGLITKEEAILIAYARGVALQKAPSIEGTLAVVGVTVDELYETLPPDISIACYNAIDNLTISGPRESIMKYVGEWKSKNKFAEIIEGANKPFHSAYISDAGDLLLEMLEKIIPETKISTEKWISSSQIQKMVMKSSEESDDEGAMEFEGKPRVLHCPEYYRRNLVNPVYFSSAMESVPKDAMVIEISPKGLLQTLIKKNLGHEAKVISLSSESSEDNCLHLLSAIGRYYS